MRVALLTSDRERCGIARYSRDLHAALTRLIDADLVPIHPWPPEGERLERLRAADVVHLQHEYSFWGTAFPPPRAYFEGLERFRKPGRLVITAHTVADAETVAAARAGGPKPLVKRLALRLRPGLRQEIETGPFLPADRVIVHSSAAAAMLGKRLGGSAIVLHWPMPVPKWSVPASNWGPLLQRLKLEGRRLVTIFGFVTPEKHYPLAMRAASLVSKKHPNIALIIAGGGRDEAGDHHLRHLQQLARKINDRERWGGMVLIGITRAMGGHKEAVRALLSPFRFTGYLNDPDARALLMHTEIALLPYRSATGSYAAGAALASGCPLLTSDLPAFAEPLPALRFRSTHVQDLVEKLNHLLSDGAARAALAERSRQYAAENSWARSAARHVALYRELSASSS